MSGRTWLPPPEFGRALRPMPPPHPALLNGPHHFARSPPPHPAILEDRLAAQHHEIQALLVHNQRLAATHVALKQELAASHHELLRASHALASLQSDKDLQLRGVFEKSMKMESELRMVEAARAELEQVRVDIQKLNATRQELRNQVQMLTQDLALASAQVRQASAIKAEIETLKQDLPRVRAATDFERKGYTENYEQGQVIEKNLISMAREVEKLRAEVANAEKREKAAAAAGNQAAGYGVNYGNSDPSYGGNPYPGYGLNPVPGSAEGVASQYASGSAHGSWGAYDVQRAHGHR